MRMRAPSSSSSKPAVRALSGCVTTGSGSPPESSCWPCRVTRPARSRPSTTWTVSRAWFSRGGVAQHRLGVEAGAREPASKRGERRACARRRRNRRSGGARGIEDRDHGGSVRSVLQRPGPAQIPAHAPHRAPSRRGRGTPPRPLATGRLVHAPSRWPDGDRGHPSHGLRPPSLAPVGAGVRGERARDLLRRGRSVDSRISGAAERRRHTRISSFCS